MTVVPFKPRGANHSANFATLHRAILTEEQVTFVYNGHEREACPHVLGHTKDQEKVLVYQFAGGSERGLDPGGQWRCFTVSNIKELKTRKGRWHTGSGHSKPSPMRGKNLHRRQYRRPQPAGPPLKACAMLPPESGRRLAP